MAPNTEKSPATLLDKLTALESAQRSEVAKELRKVAETFAEVSDGRDTAAGPSARRMRAWMRRKGYRALDN